MGFLSRLFTKPPLELTLVRNEYGKDFCGGRLLVSEMDFSDTMEPPSRHLTSDMPLSEIKKKKVAGKTAIPTGRYKITWEWSQRLHGRTYGKKYNGKFPCLNDVPGFSGILFHPLNKGPESQGCIGTGERWKAGTILNATQAYYDLMDFYLVPAFKRNQDVYITIVEQ